MNVGPPSFFDNHSVSVPVSLVAERAKSHADYLLHPAWIIHANLRSTE